MIETKKLFDEMNRDYTGPALYAEPVFDYLNCWPITNENSTSANREYLASAGGFRYVRNVK